MNISKAELLETLSQLDPTVDGNWTTEGLPSVDAVREAALDDTITRDDLTLHALGFDREVAGSAASARDELDGEAKAEMDSAPSAEDAARIAAAAISKVSEQFEAKAEQSDDERRADLAQAVLSAKEDLAQFDAALAKQRQMRDALVKAVDTATKALEAEFPPLRHADIVQQWLASEAEKRMARSLVGQRSDLDQRFSRATGYGNRRPSVPPVATHV